MATLDLVEARINTQAAEQGLDRLANRAQQTGDRIGRAFQGSNVVPFTRNARGAATALESVRRAAQSAGAGLATLNGQAATSGSLFRSVAGAAGALVTTLAGISIGRGLITINAQAQDLRRTLNATFQSADVGGFVFSELEKAAANSTQELTTLVAAVSQLQGSGFTAGQSFNEISQLIETLENGASLATNSADAFQALVRVISRSTSGGLGLEELNQIFERIPGLQIEVERALGITRAEFTEVGKTAEGAGRIVSAIIASLNQGQFAGAAQAALGGITQTLSNLSDSITAFFTRIGEGGFNDAFVRAVSGISSFLSANQELATQIGGVLGAAINTAVDAFETYGTILAGIIAIPIVGAVASLAGLVGGALVNAFTSAGGVVKVFSAILLATPIGRIVTAISGLIGIVTALGQRFLEANGITASLSETFFAIADLVGDTVFGAFDRLGSFFSNTFGPILDGLRNTVSNWANGILDAFNSVLEAGREFLGFFGVSAPTASSGGRNRGRTSTPGAEGDTLSTGINNIVDTVNDGLRDALNSRIQNQRMDAFRSADRASVDAFNQSTTSQQMSGDTPLSSPLTPTIPTLSTGSGRKARVEDPLEDITRQVKALQDRAVAETESQRIRLANLGLSDRERAVLESTLPLERERATIQRTISELQSRGVDTSILDNRLTQIASEIEATRTLEQTIQQTQRTFEFGWSQAVQSATENSTNFAQTATDLFNTINDGAASTLSRFVTEWDGSLSSARDIFAGFVDDILQQLTRIAINDLITSAIGGGGGGGATGIGSIFSAIFSAKGNAFSNGNRINYFARGGVLDGPMAFPLRNGLGVAGEAGPEGILPLQRDSRGRLGVISTGGNQGGNSIVFNVNTPDARSFQEARSEVERKLLLASRRGQRNG